MDKKFTGEEAKMRKRTGNEGKRRGRITAAATAVLFAALIGASAAVRAEGIGTKARSERLGYEAEVEAAVRSLGECAGDTDGLRAYHRAMTASERAARAGDVPAAEAFAQLAETIRQKGVSDAPIRGTVEAYFRGTLPEKPDNSRAWSSLPESVLPAGASGKAEARASSLVGEKVTLMRETVRDGDRILYAASNAYVLVDPRSGELVEFSLSLAPGEDLLDAEACADAAREFLSEACPSAVPDPTESVVDFPDPGFALVRFPGLAAVRVKRDTGRIVGFVRA